MKHFYVDKTTGDEKTHVYTCPVCDKDNRAAPIHDTVAIVSFMENKQQVIILYCKPCFSSEAPDEVVKVLNPDLFIKEDLDLFKDIDISKRMKFAPYQEDMKLRILGDWDNAPPDTTLFPEFKKKG